jgi:hypothetical protein
MFIERLSNPKIVRFYLEDVFLCDRENICPLFSP